MVSADMCKHDWPGTSCPDCRAELRAEEIATAHRQGIEFALSVLAEKIAVYQHEAEIWEKKRQPRSRSVALAKIRTLRAAQQSIKFKEHERKFNVSHPPTKG